jgi:hypothetical protein
MALAYELRRLSPSLVLAAEDAYLRERAVHGPHPEALGPRSYRVVGRVVAGAREDIDPPIELAVRRNASGHDLFFGRQRHPDGGERRVALADGTYVVQLESALYQAEERADVSLPQTVRPYTFDLRPGAAYPFSRATLPGGRGPTLVRGTWRRPDGSGIGGATVAVVGTPTRARTGADGQWVLVLPDDAASGIVTLRFSAPGAAPVDVGNVPVTAGREVALAETALRGLVTDRGREAPGSLVSVDGQPGRTRSESDGSWVYLFPLNQPLDVVQVRATLPDGRSRSQPGVTVRPRSTVVVPTFGFS